MSNSTSIYKKHKFQDIVYKDGFIRGPFGSDLKKSLFVPQSSDTYKVYEQGVVLEQDKSVGRYYISKEYFESKMSRFEVKENDFLVSCSGMNYGAIYQIKTPFERGVINQALLIIRVNSEIVDYDYFYYYFGTYIAKVITNGTGDSTIPNFPSISVIKDLNVYLPDIETQRRIGSVLSHIDKKRLLNENINDNLQQQLKLMYDYWFTQFEFPDENGKPYRSSGGPMVWNDKLSREIPLGWNIESVISNSLSTVIKPGVEVFGRKKYLATSEVNGTSISMGSIVDYATRESRANMQPTVNSVWFAKMKNSIKHLFLNEEMLNLIKSSILSTGFCGLQCTETSFEYLSSFVEHSYFETIKDTLAHGATQEAVNNDDLDGIFMVIPDEKTLLNYHEITKGIYAKISQNICENQELTCLRDWLLPMLMNGQVIISD